jgi:hypothetical protein
MGQGRDVLCVSSIDWDDNWQVHQQLATTLAAQGDRVLFVENTGVRSPTWTDAPAFGGDSRTGYGAREVDASVVSDSPCTRRWSFRGPMRDWPRASTGVSSRPACAPGGDVAPRAIPGVR